MIDELTPWLSHVLDDYEAAAQLAFSGQADPEEGWGEGDFGVVTPHVGQIHEDVQRAHVVRWHPGTVLAVIATDRQILALHNAVDVSVMRTIVDGRWVDETAPGCDYCASLCHSQSGLRCADDGLDAPFPCPTVRIVAAKYAALPGYQEVWRP